MVFPEGPDPFTEAHGSFPRGTAGTHLERGSASPCARLWSRQPFLPPYLLEYREFRRRWEPGPGWELSYSWGWLGMCNPAEAGKASLSSDLGGNLSHCECMCEGGGHRAPLLGSPQYIVQDLWAQWHSGSKQLLLLSLVLGWLTHNHLL